MPALADALLDDATAEHGPFRDLGLQGSACDRRKKNRATPGFVCA